MNENIEIRHIAPGKLTPNPWNSNRVGPEMEQRLRASIEEFGLYKPIIARKVGDQLQILGGEHRWRIAYEKGMETVPVVILEGITDERAKLLGLADNGQYGQDDAVALSAVLESIGIDDVMAMLPYEEKDLAGLLAKSAAVEIDIDNIGFDEHEEVKPIEEVLRATITHDLMRFKVPVEDREMVQKFVESVIKTRGLTGEGDSLISAGMALVEIVKLAKEAL